MENKKKLTIGIDISKKKLDITFVEDPKLKKHLHFIVSNCKEGIESIVTQFLELGYQKEDVLICFEHTGIYGMPLCFYLQQAHVEYAMIPALEIHRSKGIRRGKNDKVDSRDIAYYGITHFHKIELTILPADILLKLRLYLNLRDKLVKSIGAFQRTRELDGFLPLDLVEDVLVKSESILKNLRQELRNLDKEIKSLVDSDNDLKEKFKLATSVIGVGKQTALHLLVYTRGFTTFKNWRQLACYAGVAPFEHTSGTSVRGKTKVSNLANKKLKSILNMAAITAMRYDPELEHYYNRKLEEGKNAMLVINSIKCKILSRVLATVKRGTPFVKLTSYTH